MNDISWITTQENSWIHKWDKIQLNSTSGMFTQTSSWLNSYRSYGFDPVYFLGVKNEDICFGFACLRVKVGPFLLITCPWGPFSDGSINLEFGLKEFHSWAKSQNAFAVQINLAIGNYGSFESVNGIDLNFQKGNLTGKIFCPQHFNWINLPDISEEEYERVLLKSFSENARRNVKAALKNDLQVERVSSFGQLRSAYQCFENNAKREGYPIRDWSDLELSLNQALTQGHSIFFLVKKEDQVVGAIWAAKGGNSYHYIMGGVERTEKDLKIGHLLQWSVMQAAIQEGMKKYNISVGGSEGVVRFKSSFYPTEEHSLGVYHSVLVPWKYELFRRGYKFAEKNKKLVAKLLKLVR